MVTNGNLLYFPIALTVRLINAIKNAWFLFCLTGFAVQQFVMTN